LNLPLLFSQHALAPIFVHAHLGFGVG